MCWPDKLPHSTAEDMFRAAEQALDEHLRVCDMWCDDCVRLDDEVRSAYLEMVDLPDGRYE